MITYKGNDRPEIKIFHSIELLHDTIGKLYLEFTTDPIHPRTLSNQILKNQEGIIFYPEKMEKEDRVGLMDAVNTYLDRFI